MTTVYPVVFAQTKPIEYAIYIDLDWRELDRWLPKEKTHQYLIVTDSKVKVLYALPLQQVLLDSGYLCCLFDFPEGESSKNAETKALIESHMFEAGLGRDTVLIALGGGVVGDLAGFIAATYLRGLPYIQVPTTLLAMVDSSIGGKTGINTVYGKNLIGAVYQPQAVIIDFHCLASLSEEHLINGLVEAMKMFLTHDALSFQEMVAQLDAILLRDREALTTMVRHAIAIKSGVVMRDEHEHGERSLLNFGHTVGHALEKYSEYTLLHGHAVAYGILVESTLSFLLGLLSFDALQCIKDALSRLGFHGHALRSFDASVLLRLMKQDKKVRQGHVRYVLLQGLGCAYQAEGQYTHGVDDAMVQRAFQVSYDG